MTYWAWKFLDNYSLEVSHEKFYLFLTSDPSTTIQIGIVLEEIYNIKLGRLLIQIRIKNWVSYKIVRAIGNNIWHVM